MTLRPFHLAFPVDDLAAARAFYGGVLGCTEGRSSDAWIDFDFFGHQLVAHLAPRRADAVANPVDGHAVPVPHFGVVLTMADWQALAGRIEAAGIAFGIAPHVRFPGQAGEQATMFLRDPAGNALEFKAFADDSMIFATDGGGAMIFATDPAPLEDAACPPVSCSISRTAWARRRCARGSTAGSASSAG